MDILEITRIESTTDGVLGVLRVNKVALCCTLEQADRLNAPDVSCIPAGQYPCELRDTNHFGITMAVNEVPGRTGILFHRGNTADDTHGCILLGQYFGKLRENRAVLNSGESFKNFLGSLTGQQAILTITEAY